jgi:hypothetical protein
MQRNGKSVATALHATVKLLDMFLMVMLSSATFCNGVATVGMQRYYNGRHDLDTNLMASSKSLQRWLQRLK